MCNVKPEQIADKPKESHSLLTDKYCTVDNGPSPPSIHYLYCLSVGVAWKLESFPPSLERGGEHPGQVTQTVKLLYCDDVIPEL